MDTCKSSLVADCKYTQDKNIMDKRVITKKNPNHFVKMKFNLSYFIAFNVKLSIHLLGVMCWRRVN